MIHTIPAYPSSQTTSNTSRPLTLRVEVEEYDVEGLIVQFTIKLELKVVVTVLESVGQTGMLTAVTSGIADSGEITYG